MFHSGLSDKLEPRTRAKTDSRFFSQFKISCQKIEILARVVDLILIASASALAGIVFQDGWFENPATIEACLGAGIINGLVYVYLADARGLYRLPVLLAPFRYFDRLLAIFAATALLVAGALFFMRSNVAFLASPLVAALLPQIVLLVIARWVFAKATRTLLAAGSPPLGQRGLSADGQSRPATIQGAPANAFDRGVKRTLDVVGSITALFFLWPLFLFAAIGIKLDSGGPIIFRQRRTGLNAKEFVIFKFRTMTVLEDGPAITQACRDDLRATRFGKLLRRSSIDELPQLFNVLNGEMSLVGPRPHAVAHDKKYAVHIADYGLRHRVKPGITGWAQVNGLRGATGPLEKMTERVKLDLWYIDNWSLGFDINILMRTCFEVLRDQAY